MRSGSAGRGPVFYQNIWGALFALPAIGFLLVFNIYPLANALVISLTSWNFEGSPQFIGLGNYIDIFTQDVNFFQSVKVTALYAVGLIPGFWLALCLALLLNREFKGRGLFRTIYFTPVIVDWVVTSIVWGLVLHPSFGLNAVVFGLFHKPGYAFLDSATWVIPTIVVISLWKGTGYWMVIFLAGLQGIPSEFLEAAKVDGANAWQRFWQITLPLLRPTVLFVSVVGLINAFQVFTPVFLLTKGGPAGASRVLPLLIYQNAIYYLKMGYASALSIILLVMLMTLTLVQLRVLRSDSM